MGVGNLQEALGRYGKGDVPYAQLYFDSSPVRNFSAWRKLASLGDDSSTYYWRVLAAKEILRLYRNDPKALSDLAELQGHKASSEEVLHPEATTPPYDDGGAIDDALDSGELTPLPVAKLAQSGIRVDPGMGALAAKIDSKRRRYRALRPQALAVLEALGRGVRRISRERASLILTSSVRDRDYQRALLTTDAEATQAFSLHTTGWAFDLARVYRSSAQSHALQFMLDRLAALGLVAWVREPRGSTSRSRRASGQRGDERSRLRAHPDPRGEREHVAARRRVAQRERVDAVQLGRQQAGRERDGEARGDEPADRRGSRDT